MCTTLYMQVYDMFLTSDVYTLQFLCAFYATHLLSMKINFLFVVFRNDRRMALIQMGSTEEAIAALIVSTMKENLFLFSLCTLWQHTCTCNRAYLL